MFYSKSKVSPAGTRIASRADLARRHTLRVGLEPLEDRLLLATAPVLAAIPNGTVNFGSTFTYKATATGTPTPTFAVSTGPSGLTINSATGLISFTPTLKQVGTQSVTIRAANSAGSNSKSFKITVTNLVPPVITTPPAQTATAGAAFALQMVATGTPAPTFSLVSPPANMTITSAGLISWSPVSAPLGSLNITVSAASAAGSTSSTFAINVVPDTTPPTAPTLTIGPVTAVDSLPLSWSGATDNVGVVGYRVFTYTPAVYKGHSGRGGGYTLVSPAKYTLLVDGLTSTATTITGLTPNTTYQYAVAAYDAAGNQSAYSPVASGTTLLKPSFTWTTNGVTQNPTLSVVANHALFFELYASGSPIPTLSVISAPAGVVFTPGQITNSQLTFVIPNITWTPTESQVGLNYITMQATNSVGSFTLAIPVTVTPDTPQISLSINGGITYGPAQYASGQSNYVVNVNPAYGNATQPQYGLSNTPFNFQVSSASNSEPTTFALVSAPAGMTLDPNTGAGTWTPTKDQAGTTNVSIAATNSAGTSTLELTFPTYFTTAPGTPAATYTTTASGTTNYNPTMNWTAPSDTGGIVGYLVKVQDAHTNAITTFDTHSTATSFTLSGLGGQQYFVTVTPYDVNNNPGQTSAAVSIYGYAMPTLSWTASTPNAIVGTPVSVQFDPTGSGMAYALVSGPVGAAIDPATGLLTFTPTQPGSAPIVVAATTGWGTVDAVLNLPVYFTDAPTALAVTTATDPVTLVTTTTATWSSPTQNLSAIAAYQVQILSPSTGPTPIVVIVSATSPLSVVLSDLGITTGSIQVAALDSFGNVGLASPWVTF